MNDRRIGLLAGVVGVFGVAVRFGPGRVMGRWIDDGTFPAWAPTFGTLGETVTVYNSVFDTVGPFLTLLLAVGLGYYVGRQLDVARAYRRFVGTVLVGSTAGVVIGWALLTYASSLTSMDVIAGVYVLASFGEMFVTVSLLTAVGALAGAAFERFQSMGGAPA